MQQLQPVEMPRAVPSPLMLCDRLLTLAQDADRAGLAGVVNAISRGRQIFLADGGLGTLVGDGQLPHPGTERIVEAWYQIGLPLGVALTLDYQFLANPAYNRDRGPVHVFGLRLHAGL